MHCFLTLPKGFILCDEHSTKSGQCYFGIDGMDFKTKTHIKVDLIFNFECNLNFSTD